MEDEESRHTQMQRQQQEGQKLREVRFGYNKSQSASIAAPKSHMVQLQLPDCITEVEAVRGRDKLFWKLPGEWNSGLALLIRPSCELLQREVDLLREIERESGGLLRTVLLEDTKVLPLQRFVPTDLAERLQDLWPRVDLGIVIRTYDIPKISLPSGRDGFHYDGEPKMWACKVRYIEGRQMHSHHLFRTDVALWRSALFSMAPQNPMEKAEPQATQFKEDMTMLVRFLSGHNVDDLQFLVESASGMIYLNDPAGLQARDAAPEERRRDRILNLMRDWTQELESFRYPGSLQDFKPWLRGVYAWEMQQQQLWDSQQNLQEPIYSPVWAAVVLTLEVKLMFTYYYETHVTQSHSLGKRLEQERQILHIDQQKWAQRVLLTASNGDPIDLSECSHLPEASFPVKAQYKGRQTKTKKWQVKFSTQFDTEQRPLSIDQVIKHHLHDTLCIFTPQSLQDDPNVQSQLQKIDPLFTRELIHDTVEIMNWPWLWGLARRNGRLLFMSGQEVQLLSPEV